MTAAGEVTALLVKADAGDRAAAADLYKLVEPDLRAIAGRRKRRFAHPLADSTTMLVDDAFCRLVGREITAWRAGDRAKFFSYAATKVHDLLVEAARSRLAEKRGAGRRSVAGDDLDAVAGDPGNDCDFMLDLRDALARMEAFAPAEVRAFRIYYFLGSTFEETAALLEVSPTEAKRLCKKAQLWLQRDLKAYHHGP